MTKAARGRKRGRGREGGGGFPILHSSLPPLGARYAEFDGEGEGGRGSSECCGEDGRQIYFVRDEGCLSTWLTELEGNETRRVTEGRSAGGKER